MWVAGINPATGKSRSRLILFVECGWPDRSAQFLDLTFLESVASEACGNLATQATAWSRVASGVPEGVVRQLLQTATMLLCAALKSLYHSIFDPSDDPPSGGLRHRQDRRVGVEALPGAQTEQRPQQALGGDF